ncbi:MAG: c-type cytochrome [Polyangiaceae bacterium]
MTVVDRVKPFRRFALPFGAALALIPAVVAGCKTGFDDGPICGDVAFADGGDCCGASDGCCGEFGCPPGSQPVTNSPVRPQPLSGGTLLINKAGYTAVVSDPDRDRVLVVDLKTTEVKEVATGEGSNPGRAIEDANGVFHVLLRNSATLLNIDPADPQSWTTTPVCDQPRGIAFQDTASRILVACAAGEVQTLSAVKTPTLVSSTRLPEGDLRDIVISKGKVFVSHFRSTKIDLLDVNLAPQKTRSPAGYTAAFEDNEGTFPTYTPTVAWRMVPRSGGGIVVVHQQARSSSVVIPEEGGNTYGGFDCNSGILHSGVSTFGDDGEPANAPNAGGLAGIPLPVDLAVAHDGERIAVVGAGNGQIVETTLTTVTTHDGCGDNFPSGGGFTDESGQLPDGRLIFGSTEPVAVAYDGDDNLVVQIREPARLEIHGTLSGQVITQIDLGGDSRLDTGYTMFHGNPDIAQQAQITCASCHPEGTEDGHTWDFKGQGARRTQSLAGNIRDTAPFHWVGDLEDVGAVMSEVFVKRMGGFPQTKERVDAIQNFIFSFGEAPRVIQPPADAIARGKALFQSDEVGCATCHSGAKYTNNSTVNVGSGDSFQVPALNGIASRAPFMHDGCAATLRDRFTDTVCGGGDSHGHTSQLNDGEIDDLVAYLESL